MKKTNIHYGFKKGLCFQEEETAKKLKNLKNKTLGKFSKEKIMPVSRLKKILIQNNLIESEEQAENLIKNLDGKSLIYNSKTHLFSEDLDHYAIKFNKIKDSENYEIKKEHYVEDNTCYDVNDDFEDCFFGIPKRISLKSQN